MTSELGNERNDAATADSGDQRRVVVGVDGSEGSIAALRWALDEARAHGYTLQVVTAWTTPLPFAGAIPTPTVAPGIAEDVKRDAEDRQQTAVDKVLGDQPPVPVIREVCYGLPAAVLLEAAHGAEALVVGTRGHGGFTGMLLGSVGQHVVHHATVPVVIIR